MVQFLGDQKYNIGHVKPEMSFRHLSGDAKWAISYIGLKLGREVWEIIHLETVDIWMVFRSMGLDEIT